MARQEADVTVVSEKGQVVIPKTLRRRLGIKPKTKLLIYGYEDAVIMKKLEIPDVAREMERLYAKLAKRIERLGELRDEEINGIVQKCRHGKNAA